MSYSTKLRVDYLEIPSTGRVMKVVRPKSQSLAVQRLHISFIRISFRGSSKFPTFFNFLHGKLRVRDCIQTKTNTILNRKGQQATAGTKRGSEIVVGALDSTCRCCRCSEKLFFEKILLMLPMQSKLRKLRFQ